MTFHRPNSLFEALTLRAAAPLKILAGGTDFYPSLRDSPANFPVLDISAIDELRAIGQRAGFWSIGANVTWRDVQRADLPPGFDALKLAAREVGSLQIQNRATVVGNLCNASPAADGVPPLLVLDAQIEIASRQSVRSLPLQDFIKGNRKTSLAADEIVTRVLIPQTSVAGQSAFVKLGARKYLVISIAMVAVRVVMKENRIEKAAVAVGSCSEVAQRLRAVEQNVQGCSMNRIRELRVSPEALSELSPIDDVRAPAAYRKSAAATLIRDALVRAMTVAQ